MVNNSSTWATPITSGFESAEVRWSVPWRKQRHLDQLSSETHDTKQPGGQADLPSSTTPLVYSSISDTKQSDPIKRIDLYPVSARVIREPIHRTGNKIPPNRTGTEIQGFSMKSRARLRFTAANSGQTIKSQFCMTYGDVWPVSGRSLKNDLTLFLKRLRKRLDGLSYIWIAEFQTRGAPHFHFFSNLEPTPQNHDMLTAAWYDIAGYGQDKVLRVHAHETNFIAWDMGNAGYLCKYLDKEAQKTIPPGFQSFGRFWGNSQDLVPKVQDEITPDELKLFSVKEDKPVEYLVRNLCRYMEKINAHSTIRTTPQSRTILTGAAIAVRLRDHLLKPKKTNKKEVKKTCKTLISAKNVEGVYPSEKPAAALPNQKAERTTVETPGGGASRAIGDPFPPISALPERGEEGERAIPPTTTPGVPPP